MLIKKQEDLVEEYVVTTRNMFNTCHVSNYEEIDSLTDVVVKDVVLSHGGTYPKDEDKYKITPFLESISIVPIQSSDEDEMGGNGFIFQAQYPKKGVLNQDRCIKISTSYVSRYGNVGISSNLGETLIKNDDPNKISKIVKMCEIYSGGEASSGIGFYF